MGSTVILIICYEIIAGVQSLTTHVTLPIGELSGYISTTRNGKEFVAFEGVPYAKPPIGALRFEEPQTLDPWGGVLKTNMLHKCIQYNHYTPPGKDMVQGEEDCLYLNIYTPELDEGLRDVIIYIHGGAFMFGSGGSYGPYIILDQNIVFVTFNYRLGPLGFLSTEDEVVPGNNGLKDQILALKWVSDNIRYFGGNPCSITLTGMSAGGASAQLHSLSPLSKGLFHRGISQSGTVLNPWVLAENSLEKTKKISLNLNCTITTTGDMIACLKGKKAYDIVDSVKLVMPWLYNPISPFGVVVDKWSRKPFLKEHPYKLLLEGRINNLPWIFSNVASEGLYPAADFIAKNQYLEEIDQFWNDLIPHILDFNHTVDINDRLSVLTKIREFYFHNMNVSETTYGNLIKMVSDRLFITGIERAAKLHSISIQSPVYYYYFSYRGAHSKSELRSLTNNDYGASHGDDTVYVLSTEVNTHSTPTDQNMSKLLVNMWTSFASTGIPKVNDVVWLQMSKKNYIDSINYLHINNTSYLEMKSNVTLGNTPFWESLPLRENEKLML